MLPVHARMSASGAGGLALGVPAGEQEVGDVEGVGTVGAW